ncbi:ribosome biogenesis GTPase Der [Spiribacter vilamensis]|uniref:GTPase Der n=1 Tax=Spiribacter vilamensis TaxID=531306 RepID=A0A4Q8D0W7_9GAMM|nr:ribosome biogenesis GTPase Der [Spiribacter vilamensis]RZU98922.1 GTP-binding protein [Spiribacter vilamensis]TVO62067.1 ribosome biogenesis GTPase Der [Spiribacter vilamensis]
MKQPVIALVGRPNVGKSTLFNRLTRTRDALVADFPGLTRDRQYGVGRLGPGPYVVVDTGGLGEPDDVTYHHMQRQALRALDEADAILFLVDARVGVTPGDETLTRELRQRGKRVWLVMNKIDGVDVDVAGADFHSLGLDRPRAIAAVQGRGVRQLMDAVLGDLLGDDADTADPDAETGIETDDEDEAEDEAPDRPIDVAIIGRPNVGKSTLINRLIGEERVLVYDMPGTTRDAIRVPFERDGRAFTLIDTAGVRRRSRVSDGVEKFSVIKTLQAIESAQVVIMVLDAQQEISEQDAHLIGHTIDSGRGLVLAVNKWDGLVPENRERIRRELEVKLGFLDFTRPRFISALHGTGVGRLLEEVAHVYAAARKELSTPALNRVLEEALTAHQPPLVRGRRIKLRYAHQGGKNPPTIVIHGNQTDALPDAYRRFLINRFRQAFKLHGTPIRLELRTGENPFAGRRNKLTPRQQRKRERVVSRRRKAKK